MYLLSPRPWEDVIVVMSVSNKALYLQFICKYVFLITVLGYLMEYAASHIVTVVLSGLCWGSYCRLWFFHHFIKIFVCMLDSYHTEVLVLFWQVNRINLDSSCTFIANYMSGNSYTYIFKKKGDYTFHEEFFLKNGTKCVYVEEVVRFPINNLISCAMQDECWLIELILFFILISHPIIIW